MNPTENNEEENSRWRVFKHDNKTTEYDEYIPEELHAPIRGVFCGGSNSGKSNLCKNLVFEEYADYFSQVIIFSGTDKTLTEYREIHTNLKPTFELRLIKGYDDELAKKIINEIEQKDDNKSRLIIFDDLGFENISRKGKNNQIDRLFQTGRHNQISVFIVSQRYTDLNVSTRNNNASAIFVFRIGNNDLKKIHSENGFEESYDEFKSVYQSSLSKPYGFLLIDKVRNEYRDRELAPIPLQSVKQGETLDEVEDVEVLEAGSSRRTKDAINKRSLDKNLGSCQKPRDGKSKQKKIERRNDGLFVANTKHGKVELKDEDLSKLIKAMKKNPKKIKELFS